MRALVALAWALLAVAALPGCIGAPGVNPSFDVATGEARAALARMASQPTTLERPVIVAAGLWDPGIASGHAARRLREATGDERVVSVDFFFCGSFDACADRLVRVIEERFPSDDPERTVAVDVVGISMGGLAARHAASEREGARRLDVRRLYTLATPHEGARLAWLVPWDARVRAMRAGSDFLESLDASLGGAPYELVCYARLGDASVGVRNAAPEGHPLWWVGTPPLQLAHLDIYKDPRVLADVARRLRGEPPLTNGSATPPPGDAPYDDLDVKAVRESQ